MQVTSETVLSSSAYQLNGLAVSAANFTAQACDPRQSVVVEACAGSGKTWLLVARMLRLLLQGSAPNEILAITFTRLAAQEMRERLDSLLRELALCSEAQARQLLLERGVPEHELAQALPKARQLYAKLLGSSQNLTIDTFHSWFGRLLKLAPLASGVPHGYELQEQAGEIEKAAYQDFMRLQAQPEQQEWHQALCLLINELGDASCRNLLFAFLSKRAEWQVCQLGLFDGTPAQWLSELCAADAAQDARLQIYTDHSLRQRLTLLAIILAEGGANNQKNALRISAAYGLEPELSGFEQVYSALFDSSDKVRSHSYGVKALKQAVAKHWPGGDVENFRAECEVLAEHLQLLKQRAAEKQVLEVNQALFICGQALLDCYQRRKQALRVLDFTDLEWLTFRLLQDEELANFLHMRLDARYKHILLDEFQDTNPLQWAIVRSWLAAYSDGQISPSVFVVGDPKQSIYRFRRAEPRVFAAAREMLAAQGAQVLRTSQTRRNAQGIIDGLNQAMAENPIYQAQSTASQVTGVLASLPLIAAKSQQDEACADTSGALQPESDQASAPTSGGSENDFVIRNPLQQAVLEQENQQRYQEGQQVAQALLQLQQQARLAGQQDWSWREVMLLVRRRTHLTAYEQALREAGIPYVSNRRGGLLETLEVLDLIALMKLLQTPADSFSLAHVLKSPLFRASDDDLKILAASAKASRQNWWQCLLQTKLDNLSPALQQALQLLPVWRDAALRLSPHDLLDQIYQQGQVIARYAQALPASQRAQTRGNLEALLELALNSDGGRYPSLNKFIYELEKLQAGRDNESPDEALMSAGVDAVQILTIHAAKGLEADIVVLLDANHSDAKAEYAGILCQWPLEAGEQAHFSAFWKKEARGVARDAFFAKEEQLAQQENWNLLYVAATRARQILLLSGVAGRQNESWYQKLQPFAMEFQLDQDLAANLQATPQISEFSLSAYQPLNLPPLSDNLAEPEPSQEQLEGIALHSLLQRLTEQNPAWPLSVPEPSYIAAWVHCPLVLAKAIAQQAQQILHKPELRRFFDAKIYTRARNEMTISFQGQILRLDRIVWLDEAIWILDYKRTVDEGKLAAYQQQVARYRQAVAEIYTDKPVFCCLIAANAELFEVNFEQNPELLV